MEELIYSLLFGLGGVISYLFGRKSPPAREDPLLLKFNFYLMAVALAIASLLSLIRSLASLSQSMEEFLYLLLFLVASRLSSVWSRRERPWNEDLMAFGLTFYIMAIGFAICATIIWVRIIFRQMGDLDKIEELVFSLIFGMGSAILYLFGRSPAPAKEPTGLLKLTSYTLAVSLGMASAFLFVTSFWTILFD